MVWKGRSLVHEFVRKRLLLTSNGAAASNRFYFPCFSPISTRRRMASGRPGQIILLTAPI